MNPLDPSFLTRAVTSLDGPIIAQHRYDGVDDEELLQTYAAWVAGAIGRRIYLGWFVEHEHQVIAGAGLSLLEWGPTLHSPNLYRGRIGNVYTAPAWRRQGLARHLVVLCLHAAQAKGITQVGLSTSEMARPLYEQLGFRAYGPEMLLVL